MNLFIINGMPQSGKSTFAEMCCDFVGPYGLNLSTVDLVKDLARQAGWNGQKTGEERAKLAAFKDCLTRWWDSPFQDVTTKAELFEFDLLARDAPLPALVFIHCREPQEIRRFVYERNARTILVRRQAVESEMTTNAADAGVFDYPNYDLTIHNDGTLEDLQAQAEAFCTKLGYKRYKFLHN